MKATNCLPNFASPNLAWLLVIALSVVGCKSTGYKKSDGAAKSLNQAAEQVQVETRHIDATVEALADLVNNPAPDLKPQFRRFSKSLDRLIDSAEDIQSTRERMERKSTEYFAAWDQEAAAINYGKIREQSELRRAEVTNRFHTVNVRYQESHEVVSALISYFTDIRTALSVDLTRGGLDSVKEIAHNAYQNADKVKLALGRLSDELASSSAALSSMARETSPNPGRQAETIESRVSVRSAETNAESSGTSAE